MNGRSMNSILCPSVTCLLVKVYILIVYRMGGSGSKNDDFSQNPHFNMNQHRQAMQNLSSNYTVHNLNYQSGNPASQANV